MNLCIDPILKDLLKDRGITATVYDAVLPKLEKQQMLEDLEVFASSWFMRNGKDITEYRNVSIGASIHDDILTLFSYLNHITLVLQKVKYNENTVVFYQSESCHLPDNVERILVKLGIRIETTNDQYPFLCYKKYFEKSAYTRGTYSGIVYDKYSKTKYISTIKPKIRSLIYKIIFILVNRVFLNSKKIIYLRPMRRLQPMLQNFMNDTHKDKDINIQVEFYENHLLDLLDSQNYLHPLRFFKQLIWLAKKGIFFKYPIILRAPMNGRVHNYLNRKAKLGQIKIIENSKRSIEKLLGFNDTEISNLVISEFLSFYFHHFNKFTALIDKINRKVKTNKVNNYMMEYISPFMAQVLANNNKNI